MEVETGAGEGAEPDIQFGLVRVTASVEPGGLMTRALTLLFAVAGGVAVGNLYLAQPLLDLIAQDLGASTASAGWLVTATQLGYAAGILLIVPLGDVRRRSEVLGDEVEERLRQVEISDCDTTRHGKQQRQRAGHQPTGLNRCGHLDKAELDVWRGPSPEPVSTSIDQRSYFNRAAQTGTRSSRICADLKPHGEAARDGSRRGAVGLM